MSYNIGLRLYNLRKAAQMLKWKDISLD